MERRIPEGLKGAALAVMAGMVTLGATEARAEALEGGTLRVALLHDMTNFDPMQFSAVNFFLIKNLYDSLIEYDAEGGPTPNLATEWEIAEGNTSVTVTLRDDVTFASGNAFDADAVAATWEKAADPTLGKNVYPTMSIVEDWVVEDSQTITLNFTSPVPDRQILDLLQFTLPIDPEGIETVENEPAGTGPFRLRERLVGQSITLEANPDYWREGEPILDEVVFTIFSDDDAASAALESGAVDMVYDSQSRSAARLGNSGFQLIDGPGKLVQVFRINSTRGPFQNAEFRRAFNYLMNREGILQVGYAGLGEVTALPWAPVSPAFDASYNEEFAYDLEKAREHLEASGLSEAEMSDWSLLVDGGSEDTVRISQVGQAALSEVGINIELDLRQGAEYIDALLGGDFAATFGGVGNVQKFPSRVATNSIYRTTGNPVLGDPHPHPAYLEAIERVNTTFGSEEAVEEAYAHLNRVLVEEAFGIPTNSYEVGLIVAAPNVAGFTSDIDNLLVARTIGFR